MILLYQNASKQRRLRLSQHFAFQSGVAYSMSRQAKELSVVKRERWTEADVENLPVGEHDYFDRKSGAILNSESNFLKKLAKELSAFSNSGGGSLIIGVRDDGTPDGVPPIWKNRSTREWIEQIVPALLDYQLGDFRVHFVERSSNSRIPEGKEIVVIDIGDSAAAPHKSTQDNIYYRREGSHSKPAPHFHLEMIRQRFVGASLKFELRSCGVDDLYEYNGGLFMVLILEFAIENTGRIAAYEWELLPRRCTFSNFDSPSQYPSLRFQNFPNGNGKYDRGILINKTILPGCTTKQRIPVGIAFAPETSGAAIGMQMILDCVYGMEIFFQSPTETSPGEERSVLPKLVVKENEFKVKLWTIGERFFTIK